VAAASPSGLEVAGKVPAPVALVEDIAAVNRALEKVHGDSAASRCWDWREEHVVCSCCARAEHTVNPPKAQTDQDSAASSKA
jgi:hypothetical protein